MSLYSVLPTAETMPKARAAAQRALQIDADLAEAHTSLAYTRLYFDWDWPEAETGFLRALELNPSYATAYHWYHELLTAQGRFEQQREALRRAKELDPLSLIINAELGWGLYFARQYDRAIPNARHTLEMDPGFPITHYILGLLLQQKGLFAEAVDELEQAIQLLQGGPFTLAFGVLGYIYGRWGKSAQAHEQLQRLGQIARSDYAPAYASALVHTGLDQPDEAIQLLEDAFTKRYNRMIYLNVEPMFDSLRPHPGFQDLLHRIGLS